MKKLALLPLILSLLMSAACCAASNNAVATYGALNVFARTAGANIFVDGQFVASGEAKVEKIQAGTHFLKISTGKATSEVTIYADVIDIKADQVTTIYVSESGKVKSPFATAPEEQVDVFKTKRVLDYSKEMHTGWYLKTGYLTNHYFHHEDPHLNNEATSLDVGLGCNIPLAPYLDLNIEMDRSQMSSSNKTWYFMPVLVNIQMSNLPSPYFRGKQYYGLGLGYYMTDLETPTKQNLTALGYYLFCGIEMPASDMGAYFFQLEYHVADMSRYDYNLDALSVSAGYRWDVKE